MLLILFELEPNMLRKLKKLVVYACIASVSVLIIPKTTIAFVLMCTVIRFLLMFFSINKNEHDDYHHIYDYWSQTQVNPSRSEHYYTDHTYEWNTRVERARSCQHFMAPRSMKARRVNTKINAHRLFRARSQL